MAQTRQLRSDQRGSNSIAPSLLEAVRSVRLPYRVISRVLALLLLSAAILKLFGLGAEAVGRLGFFSSVILQVAVIEAEIALGAWLLSGEQPIGSWLVSLLVFMVFAGVSLRQSLIGAASCGCFGKLSINPWYAFGLDVGVLALLAAGRPDLAALRAVPFTVLGRTLRPALLGLAGGGVALGLLAGVANWRFGSPEAALAYLRSERVSIYPRRLDLGTVPAGQEREIQIEVVNRMPHGIRVIGGTSD